MTRPLSEDDIYRASSQFRLWSYSQANLAAVRTHTHELAAEQARRRLASNGEPSVDGNILTAEDELRLVQRYCEVIRSTNDHFEWPINVKATAVQFLKRFYLSNSCLTYPPKEIYKTVLYLACKTEATHMTLSEYARRIQTDPEQVLAPEYKVMQALRFTLDVKHPYRGLKGVLMELLNLAAGVAASPPDMDLGNGSEMQQKIRELEQPESQNRTRWSLPKGSKVEENDIHDRIQAAYLAAKFCLDAPALLTDVYFLFTPSQILLAALLLSDAPLTRFYLDTKLPQTSALRLQIVTTVESCASLLGSHDQGNILSKEERAQLESRLELCRNPATKDLVKVFAAAKQGADDDDENGDKARANKKKAEREKASRDDDRIFGGDIPRKNGA